MPVYSYICPKCGKTKEVLKELKDYDKPEKCECGAEMKKKVNKISFKIR